MYGRCSAARDPIEPVGLLQTAIAALASTEATGGLRNGYIRQDQERDLGRGKGGSRSDIIRGCNAFSIGTRARRRSHTGGTVRSDTLHAGTLRAGSPGTIH